MKYFRFIKYGIEWDPYGDDDDVIYEYYFYFMPNSLGENYRYFGYRYMWYDGPHYSFGFWWFNICWNFDLRTIKYWIFGK